MQIDQIAIAVLGAAAAWLSQARSEAFRRWACIFGMQPSTSGFTPLERATNEALHFVGDLQERLDALCAVPCDRKPTPRLPIRANEASVRNQPEAAHPTPQ